MKNVFACMQHHNWSYTEIMEMLPWERDIYFKFLIDHIKEENEKVQEHNRKMK